MDMTEQNVDGALPEWILLLPVGQVELLDRPEPLQVDPESLAEMVRAFLSRGVDLVIDYEHQSLANLADVVNMCEDYSIPVMAVTAVGKELEDRKSVV